MSSIHAPRSLVDNKQRDPPASCLRLFEKVHVPKEYLDGQ